MINVTRKKSTPRLLPLGLYNKGTLHPTAQTPEPDIKVKSPQNPEISNPKIPKFKAPQSGLRHPTVGCRRRAGGTEDEHGQAATALWRPERPRSFRLLGS